MKVGILVSAQREINQRAIGEHGSVQAAGTRGEGDILGWVEPLHEGETARTGKLISARLEAELRVVDGIQVQSIDRVVSRHDVHPIGQVSRL